MAGDDEVAFMAESIMANPNYDQMCPEDRADCMGYFDAMGEPRGLTRMNSVGIYDPCPIDAVGKCPWAAERASRRQGSRLRAMGFGKRHFGAVWERVPTSVAGKLRDYCATVPAKLENGEGLILSGQPGNGKTSCLALVALAAQDTGAVVQYVTCADLFDKLYRDRDAADNAYRGCDLLLLDDLGRQYNAEYGLTGFLALMDYRYREMKSLCIATNLSAGDVQEAVGGGSAGSVEWSMGRLREINKWYTVVEQSQRRAKDDVGDPDSIAEADHRQDCEEGSPDDQ